MLCGTILTYKGHAGPQEILFSPDSFTGNFLHPVNTMKWLKDCYFMRLADSTLPLFCRWTEEIIGVGAVLGKH